jgi:hypothetical protein
MFRSYDLLQAEIYYYLTDNRSVVFCNIVNIIMIGLITFCLNDVVAVVGDIFDIYIYIYIYIYISLKVCCPSSGTGCDIALVFYLLVCWSDAYL